MIALNVSFIPIRYRQKITIIDICQAAHNAHMMNSILLLEEVSKTYGTYTAVDRVSCGVARGSIFGLLGPNGAGKTSLIRIITTIIKADSGKILFDGVPLNSSHPKQIGYMPEERGLYKKMKVGEHLMYLGRLRGLKKEEAMQSIAAWFQRFEIDDWWDKKVEELSKGMQQKIQFISTVLHNPPLLILDEPFSGLDPLNTNLLKEEIRKLNQEGTTIIFSTHRMEQVEEMCEFILLMHQGKNVLEGKVDHIKDQFKENLFSVTYKGDLPENMDNIGQVIRSTPGQLIFQLTKEQSSNELVSRLLRTNINLTGFNEILPSLNEIFIRQVEEADQQPAISVTM